MAVPGFYDRVREATAEERAQTAAVPFSEEEFLTETGAPAVFGAPGYTTRERIWHRPTLEINGVGWNAKAQGKNLQLNVGYCHPVDMTPPPGVEFAIERNMITIQGADKQAVGQFAANIRAKRPPEPYNGKGIKYTDEHIIRKQGKVFGS